MRKNVLTTVCLGLVLCALSTGSALASNAAPGSAADPLVSQGYVDEKINALYQMIASITGGQDSGMTSVEKNVMIEEIMSMIDQRLLYDGRGSAYTPVFAYGGQCILGGEGTEIILRSGQALAYVNGQNGLTDVTAGRDLLDGEVISTNHMLIVPRNDGRGLRALTDVWMLIKGTYTIIY